MGKRIFAIAMALAMLVVLAVPVGVGAADIGTSNVTGTLGADVELSLDNVDTTFGAMSLGNNPISDAITVNVTANSGWTVTIKDQMATVNSQTKDASIAGKMWTGATGTTLALTNALTYTGGDATDVSLTSSAVTIETGTESSHFHVSLEQNIVGTDAVSSAYEITIEFSVSAS